jgi:photosystem II stability/assembly factor-like uncharacterized protein
MFILMCFVCSKIASGQWVSVLDHVVPVDIAISPDYFLDQTIYVLDNMERLYISETGGTNWTLLYEAIDPSNPAMAVRDIVLSPNFKNDDAIVLLHKDGTAIFSNDRGQNWFRFPVPDGTAGIVFSPKLMEDYKIFAITGVYGPVKFYKSVNGGATWTLVSDLGIGGGFYCRLWNSSDTASVNNMVVLYDSRKIYLTSDAGVTWRNSFSVEGAVSDLSYSPHFSADHTMFLAIASEILKNENAGDSLSWVNSGTFSGSSGIRLAISAGYQQDQTIFAAVDQFGIMRSINGGTDWDQFNDGFNSILPISISISQREPYTLFAGSVQTGGAPDKLWRFQTSSGIADQDTPGNLQFGAYPNPFSAQTEITFETLTPGHVQLILYDLSGKKLKVLKDEYLGKGTHQVNLDAIVLNLNPGVYFCSLLNGDIKQVIRLILK